jgi:hypothetical protein
MRALENGCKFNAGYDVNKGRSKCYHSSIQFDEHIMVKEFNGP